MKENSLDKTSCSELQSRTEQNVQFCVSEQLLIGLICIVVQTNFVRTQGRSARHNKKRFVFPSAIFFEKRILKNGNGVKQIFFTLQSSVSMIFITNN